ncbi:unnamed protein product [Camellia sinensis]
MHKKGEAYHQMLSIENPPPDPPCPCEISHLKSCSDERASDKVALQEVDLLKSGLDSYNPLPKFSIRDYVFGSRSKDIKNSWPFSQENLQLCLKHGVKDLLPPFQPLDSVRNRVFERCAVETSLIGKENISNFDGEPSGPSDHFVSMSSDHTSCDKNLAPDCVNIGLIGSEAGKELERNQPHSEINSVPTDLEATVPPVSPKTESDSTNQPPVKKCRLIVKVGSGDPSSNQDTSANCVAAPDTMASNVCPVCKVFSSPSNTTLNAHIDQCLSVESTVKWTANSRVIKHRIKPRKTRLMVDIYTTARHCTLEELDKRNGTSWATNSCLPSRETVERSEEEKQRVSPVNSKDKGHERAVYIDSNGTKLRILSMFSDTSSVPKLEADPGPRKSKLLKNLKKRHHAQKHHKYLKLAPQSKKFCTSKARRISEVHGESGGRKRNFASEESCRKEERLTQPFNAQDQIKPNDSGTITKWACSKRTGHLKRRNRKEGLQHLGGNFRQELLVESDQSSLGESYMERSRVQKTPNSYESPLSSPESSKRMENYLYEAPINECDEPLPVRKRVVFNSFGSGKQLRKDSTSVDGSFKDFASNGENYVPYFGKELVEVNDNPVNNSSQVVCSNLSRSHRAFSSKSTKLSSLRKRMLSVQQSSLPESKYKVNRKCLSRKKSGVLCMPKIDKGVVALAPEGVEKHDSMEKHFESQSRIEKITGKVSLGRGSVLKIKKKRRAFSISEDEESMALQSASEYQGDEVQNDDLADRSDDIKSGGKGIQTHGDNIVTGTSSVLDVGRNVASLSKSLVPDFHKLASPSNALTGSLQSAVFKRSLCGVETPSCPTDPSLGDEQEMFCVDEVGNTMITQKTDMGAEMDSNDGQRNYFTEVDPIPIPGPPGSFLPSPRDMGSEDLQGNSSLTTSLVQTSEDHHDLVDRDSSDSPISAMSTISNSMIARSGSKSSERLSVGPHVTQDEITARVPHPVTLQAERVNPDGLKVNMIVPEKEPISFRNDQPCCCLRKEGMPRGVSLNYQESQLLRRRTMASLPVPAMGKQLSLNMPEVISWGNFPSSGSEKVVFPVTNSVVAPVSVKVAADSTLKSPIYGDCDSASPSASNPVLRLMGKNLMVVNKEENVSPQFRPAQSGSLNDHPNLQFRTLSGVSPGNIQSEDLRSFHHMAHQYPPTSSQNQFNTGFQVELPNNFGGHVSHWTSQIYSHASAGTFLHKNVDGGFAPSLEPHEYKVRYSLPNDQNRSRDGPYTPLAYNMEKVATISDTQRRNADSITNPAKEIIVIDDTPEKDADVPYSEGMKESRVSSAGISIPMAANYHLRHVNPFYSYQPQDSSPYNGASASPINWNCTSEGSNVIIPPSSLMASSSSSTGHLRSSLYYSPNFS